MRKTGKYHVMPQHIRSMIRDRRSAKKRYQRILDPDDKKELNRLSNRVKAESSTTTAVETEGAQHVEKQPVPNGKCVGKKEDSATHNIRKKWCNV